MSLSQTPTQPSSRPLALELPLRGSQLIEASAGTGKTFTIALLYVRLVLGHGQPDDDSHPQDNGFHVPLVPPDILVVTFTEAASQELRNRIRARLVQAADAFRQTEPDDGLAQSDPLLAALRDDYPRKTWPHCARRLEVAAEWMDDAAISTIHSWAQRMLKEHAFDSGKLFQQEVVKDLAEMTQQAVFDYWRTRVYPLSEALAAAMMALFDSPFQLHSALRTLLQRRDAILCLNGEPLQPGDLREQLASLTSLREKRAPAEARARDAYSNDADAIHQALRDLRGQLNGSTFRGKNDDATFESWLEELAAWGRGERSLEDASFVPKLAASKFKLNKGATLPDFDLHTALDHWHEVEAALDEQVQDLKPQVLADARAWVSARLAEQLALRAQMGFDDMIQGLANALSGDGGEVLALRLREQFPVAMIDEFQDTDPAQYRIFDAIYRVADNDPASSLILIGDPKQAIYGFRGGDIYTYLKARLATAPRHHTLDTNFRSSEAVVDSVNQLFQQAEKDFPRGAFRFAVEGAASDNPMPFHCVDANGRAESLRLGGEPASVLTAWLVGDEDEPINKDRYLNEAARHCANQIATWLNQAQHGEAGFQHADKPFEPLKASDIAILVRDRKEAAAIREALSARNLASVYLSDRNSVFATAEAQDMWRWLKAMAEPDAVATLRTALVTTTLGLSLHQLDALQQNELDWEATQERFAGYRARWQQRGVLPALRQLMHDYKVPERLLATEQGERRLTNLLHLAEWAQNASDALDGDHALIRVLGEHIEQPSADEQILRLESDARLIQVVTIFKAKGLEYPVVILPFICSFNEINGKWGTPLFHDDNDRPLLELAAKKDQAKASFDAANDERLSEEMRLLYVALTRARHATFVGLAPLKHGNSKTAQLEKSGIGYLLAGGQKLPDLESLKATWETHRKACSGITHSPAVSDNVTYQPPAASQALKSARTPSHRAFTPWWIASYSSLQQKGANAPETPKAEVENEEHQPVRQTLVSGSPEEAGTLHAFPRGPNPGTFLHGVLETLANEGFARPQHDPRLIARMKQRCTLRGREAHASVLEDGITAWLNTPLAAKGHDGPMLSALSHYRAEPDFWFATANAKTPVLDKLVRETLFPNEARPTLGFQRLNGLMKGFIDLLAEYNGQYYVIDWKSNWLGPSDSAYTDEALTHAALDKRYDMQLAVYLLALHRHLRQTLPDYDYDRHVGGAMLVFLRGIHAPTRGVLKIKPPRVFIERFDAMMAGQDTATVANDSKNDAKNTEVC
ncbi:exodeoxyribonuclease V subunit beta [Vreelandella rituensis]|uniref:RecBCD enzyme subunit RecB n=1 Tax=Vreelandella rituensis TaxID=2282306 RepID=A0A368TXS1_9GAMM|nr:exodeoxyribonuclease V subunit beta [Halomonas rituensis]RCV89037.1 exodeoxyribonuclease V subunit beta [Halomonas rituensis]